MTRQSLFIFFLACIAFTIPAEFIHAQQYSPPANAKARQAFNHSLRALRAELQKNPIAAFDLHASKGNVSDPDSSLQGGIAGQIEGITPGDSVWVLAIAAHLPDDPTAWALGEVRDDGSYVIPGLNMGVYIVMAGAEGYMPQYFSYAYHIWEAAPLDVYPPEITNGVDFYLEPLVQGSGSISGVVTVDAADDEPIPGATLVAYPIGNPFYSEVTYADENGRYTFERLRPGEYIITAEAEWFFGETYDNIPFYSDEEPTPVPVADGEEVRGINFALSRGGTISGQIVDQNGDPIVGAEVWAYPPSEDGQPYPDDRYYYGYGYSDENGNYFLSGLFEGDYYVVVNVYNRFYPITQWYENASSFEEAIPVPVTFGENTPDINFTIDLIEDFGSLSGTIQSEDGQPIVEAQVRLESLTNPNYYYYVTAYPDGDGRYRFEEVPEGSYRVALEYWTEWYYRIIWYENAISPENATPVDVIKDQETENINFILPESNGSVTGIVTDENGTPIPNAYIQLGDNEYGFPNDYGFLWGYATTDEDGRYTISNIPDGEYYLSVFFCHFYDCVQRWWPDVEDPAAAEPVIVTDGTTQPESIDFKLPVQLGNSTLSGTVLDQDGAPLTQANVSIMPYEVITPGGTVDLWSTQLHTITDSEGKYSFSTLPAGTYLVYTSYWGEGSFDEQWYSGAENPTDATPISLNENDVVENIDFNLEVTPLYGALYGRVFLDDGSSIERGYIKAYPLYEEYYSDIAFWGEWFAIINDDGSFILDGLPAGEYSISVYAQGASQLLVDETGMGLDIIRIEGGERTEAEFLMRRQEGGPALLSGLVQGEQGSQPETAVVIATPATDGPGEPYYTAIIDENGAYTFDGLPEGAYFVQAMAPWFMTEYYDDTTDPAEATLVEVAEVGPAISIDFVLSNMYYILAEPAEDENSRDAPGASVNASTVKGYVKEPNDNPISGATVYVVNELGEALLSAETRQDGSYQIFGIPPGESYHLKATHVGFGSAYNNEVTILENAPTLTMNSGSYEFNFVLTPAIATDIENPTPLPQQLILSDNYPNPFSTHTSISLTLPERMHVTVSIFDVLGREVDQLADKTMNPGSHTLTWQVPNDMPSGLYFYRVTNGKSVQSGSMTYFK